MPGFFSPESRDLNRGVNGRQKISLRKGDLPPLRGGLPAVECGFAPHTRPLKATNYHSSVVTVWTLPSLQFHVVDSAKWHPVDIQVQSERTP